MELVFEIRVYIGFTVTQSAAVSEGFMRLDRVFGLHYPLITQTLKTNGASIYDARNIAALHRAPIPRTIFLRLLSCHKLWSVHDAFMFASTT